MWDAGEPDDAVCKIRRCIVGDESVKPTNQLRNGKFFGKNNAGMDPSGFVPLRGEPEEVFVVECEDRSPMACGKGQLSFIRTTQIPSVPCRDAVNSACTKQRSHGQVDVFIQIDLHATRLIRYDGVWN